MYKTVLFYSAKTSVKGTHVRDDVSGGGGRGEEERGKVPE